MVGAPSLGRFKNSAQTLARCRIFCYTDNEATKCPAVEVLSPKISSTLRADFEANTSFSGRRAATLCLDFCPPREQKNLGADPKVNDSCAP
jgi:hypothetical protein